MRRWIVNGGAVLRVDRRGVVLIANAEGQCEVRPGTPSVLCEEVIALRPQMLRIVQAGDGGNAGDILQHLSQRVSGEAHELDHPPGLHVREGILLQAPDVEAKLD